MMCLEVVAPRGQMPVRRNFSANLLHQGEIALQRKAHHQKSTLPRYNQPNG
jgi:hypothetical protein